MSIVISRLPYLQSTLCGRQNSKVTLSDLPSSVSRFLFLCVEAVTMTNNQSLDYGKLYGKKEIIVLSFEPYKSRIIFWLAAGN